VTTLLYALGLDQEAICDAYFDTVMFRKEGPRAGPRTSSPSGCAA
jgi:DNA-directed RNA polymerase subunit beta